MLQKTPDASTVFVYCPSLTWPEQHAAPPPSCSIGSSAPLSGPEAQSSGPAGQWSRHPVCVWPSPALAVFSPPSLSALKGGTITCLIGTNIHGEYAESKMTNNYDPKLNGQSHRGHKRNKLLIANSLTQILIIRLACFLYCRNIPTYLSSLSTQHLSNKI